MRWTAVGLTAALVVVLGLAAVTRLGDGGGPEPDPPASTVVGDEAVADFLSDLEASLTGTYVVRSTFERRRGEEVVGRSDQTVVQRPPDRLTVREGSASGRLNGRAVTCTGEGRGAECLIGSEPIDEAAEVEEQLTAVEGYVTGDPPLYTVVATGPTEVVRQGGQGDRCYVLDLLRQLPVAPYGTQARFCFDPATGAPTLLRVERPEAVDVTTAVAVTGQVTDADLELPSMASSRGGG